MSNPVTEIEARLRLMKADSIAMRQWINKYPVKDPVQRKHCVELAICPDCGAHLLNHTCKSQP